MKNYERTRRKTPYKRIDTQTDKQADSVSNDFHFVGRKSLN